MKTVITLKVNALRGRSCARSLVDVDGVPKGDFAPGLITDFEHLVPVRVRGEGDGAEVIREEIDFVADLILNLWQ
jgi:hypothetical protein